MNPQTRFSILPNLLLLLVASQVACPAWHGVRNSQAPAPQFTRLEPVIEEEWIHAHDQPDEARQYYLMKRNGPDGNPVDMVGEYRKAIERIDRMPRYSTRAGRSMPALADARRSQGAHPLGQTDLLTTWESVGPGNIGGRTRALLIDPDQYQIMYAAGVSGGIWKTENGGDTWHLLSDLLPNIAVNSMAMDPVDHRIIYAGTGEGYFREVVRGTGLPLRGEGILKSEDGGESWARLPSTFTSDFYWVNDIVISHSDTRRIYAATRTGVWRSADAGRNWSRILNAEDVNGGCLDLALRVDRSNDYLFASCGTFQQATVYANAQAELDGPWIPVLSEYGMGRTSLAIAPSNPDIIYALSASYVPGPNGWFDGGLHAVFRSDQGGAAGTWRATVRNTNSTKLNTLLLTNPLAASYRICGLTSSDSYSTLGWYTNVIAVDPVNPEIVFAGGVDLFRSDDGGSNWGPISFWAESPPSAHADQHVIVFQPGYNGTGNQTLYVGGDGGIWRTINARAFRSLSVSAPCSRNNSQVSWTSLNHNYGVTQFYHGAPFPDGKSYLGGTQDNGTIMGSDQRGGDGWQSILGGDGGYVAVDFDNPSIVYAEYQYLSLRKSTDGGRTLSPATSGISEPNSGTLFIAPFTMDSGNSKRLWLGGHSIWRTSNGAVSWVQAGQKLSETAKVSAIAVSPADSDRVLVGMNDGSIYLQKGATQSNSTTGWPSTQPRPGYVTSLTFDPTDSQIAYATYAEFGGPHVWKSTDGGETWIPMDGAETTGLPDIPVHSLVVNPDNRQQLYLGTDLGVFTTRQGGNVWAVENTGFANVVTESLSLQQRPGAEPVLWAFTHGRGAWRVSLASGSTSQPCTPERWIQHVTPAGIPYETTLFMTNFAASQAQVELVPYLEDGTRLASVSRNVKPGETLIAASADLFLNQSVSHFGICGSSSVSVTAAYRSTDALSSSAHVPEDSARGTKFLFYPGEWDVVFDGLAVVNLGAQTNRVEAVFLDESGAELLRTVLNPALPPYAKHLAVLDWEFRGLRGAVIRIECSQPASILFLRGTHPGASTALLYQILPAAPGTDGTAASGPCNPQRWILHVAPPSSGYDTVVLATNSSGSDGSLEFVPFRDDGTRLDSIFQSLLHGRSVTSLAPALFPGIPISHFGVCSPQTLRVTSAYRPLSGLGASAHVPEVSLVDTQFLLYPGSWHVVFEGMAVVNQGTRPERVEAVLLNAVGNEVRRVQLTDNLAPSAKYLAVLDAVFTGYAGVAIRIDCSEPSSLLLLRGTKPGLQPGVLFQTVPIAITPRR